MGHPYSDRVGDLKDRQVISHITPALNRLNDNGHRSSFRRLDEGKLSVARQRRKRIVGIIPSSENRTEGLSKNWREMIPNA
jgi:hypothetical protein